MIILQACAIYMQLDSDLRMRRFDILYVSRHIENGCIDLFEEAVMLNKSVGSTQAPASRIRFWSTPHRLILTIMWLITTAVMVTMLWLGVRETGRYVEVRYIVPAGYVAALIWYLIRSGPSLNQLPELQPLLFPRRRFGAWIPVLGIALLLYLTATSNEGLFLFFLVTIVATIWILIAWRRQIRLRSVVQGLGLALIIYFPAFTLAKNDSISELIFFFLLVFVAPMYIAGGLLVDHTNLGDVQLLAKRYRKALESFIWGCLLFIPLGLADATAGARDVTSSWTWMNEWWMPFVTPLSSAIAEETWFRLLLLSLCYFLLRPAFPRRPAVPMIIAVLFNGITFGLLHELTMYGFLVTGLLYGLPMAAVFARRDWEHAVGAHYMINMIPSMMVYLETL